MLFLIASFYFNYDDVNICHTSIHERDVSVEQIKAGTTVKAVEFIIIFFLNQHLLTNQV